MNRNTLTRIASLAALVALVSFLIAWLIGYRYISTCTFRNPPQNRGHNAVVSQSESVSGKKVRHINVEVVSEDIRIREYGGGSIKVRMYGKTGSTEGTFPLKLPLMGENRVEVSRSDDDKPILKMTQNGDAVEIRVERKKRSLTMCPWYNCALEISVPKQFAGELSVKGVSSDITMERHSYERLSLVTVSGDIRSDAFAEDVYAHSVSGDVYIDSGKSSGKVSTDTVSGDVRLGMQKNAGFTLEASSISGDITCDFPLTSSQTGGRGHSLSGTVGNGKSSISAHTVSGDIALTRR